MNFIYIVLLGIGFLATLLVNSALNSLPPRELHRRARSELPGHAAAKRLASFSNYGRASSWLLWLVITTIAAILIIWAARTSVWLAILTIILISLLLILADKPILAGNWQYSLAGYLAAVDAWLLHWFEPLFGKLSSGKPKSEPTWLYEAEDLLNLLARQVKQADNRISEQDLATARAALSFSTKHVSELMVPMRDVRIVLPDEAIGPHLMDELYATNHLAFPVGRKVGKKLPPELTGTVYLDDLVNKSLKGTAAEVMNERLFFISQNQTLNEALETFIRAHNTLLIVINEREEPIGALWLEDVLAQLAGRRIMPELDNPADADEREKVVES